MNENLKINLGKTKQGYKTIKHHMDVIRKRPSSAIAIFDSLYGVAVGAFERIKIRPKEEKRTFQEDVQKYGLTEEDLAQTRKNFLIKAGLSLVFGLYCLFGSVSHGLSFSSLVYLVFAFFLSLMFATSIHKSYQVRQRKYCSFKEFYKAGLLFQFDKV